MSCTAAKPWRNGSGPRRNPLQAAGQRDAMPTKKPRRREAAGRGVENSVTGTTDSTPSPAHKQPRTAPAPALDLLGLRERLLEARSRLVERMAEDYPADRRFPDSAWTRMLADIHIAIAAVDAVVAEGGS